jgi:hypothetical protein
LNNPFESFLKGAKPACLCHCDEDRGFLQKLTASRFPKVQIRDNLTLFFQNEELKNRFLTQSKDLEPGTPEHHRVLGEALGYPPLATKFFAESWTNQALWKDSARYDYCGFYFGGRFSDAIPIAEWLWENVPLPPSEVKLTTPQGDEYRVCPFSRELKRVTINT